MYSHADAMGSLSLVLFLSHILISLISLTAAQTCYSTGNFTTNSTYGQNRNLILSSLSSNITASNGGFYTATIGQGTDKVYALALCRGDVSAETCSNCVNSTAQTIINNCPNQKEAIAWPDGPRCIVRYSNRDIFGKMEVSPNLLVYNTGDISSSDLDEYKQVWANLLNTIITRAAAGSSRLKYATQDAKFAYFRRIYAMVQCTPDLSQSDCSECLRGAVADFEGCCNGKQGGVSARPSCFMRSDLYSFAESTADAPPPQSTPPPPPPAVHYPPLPETNTTTGKDNRSSTSRTIIMIVAPIVILLTLIALTYAYFLVMRRKKDVKNEHPKKSMESSLRFDFSTIRDATDDFSDANKLGQGGFGSVYKGRISDGQEIAVKRLKQHSAQGQPEFRNEIMLMARLQHRNLVRLLGFCLEGRERLLIYEFVPNASLDRFIFDPIRRVLLDWNKRCKIIVGVARGILYLHEESQVKIIHCDLKAANVLLDGEMNSKISDFGMARLFVTDQSRGNTRNIVGTYGYMAPEYANHGQISVKTDVFSFGVLVLEIVSGRKNNFIRDSGTVEHLLSDAWKMWREGRALNLVDPILRGSSRSEIMRCIHIGLLCVQENVANRPTMASVVLMLSSYSVSLPSPSQPGLLMYSDIEPDTPLLEHNEGGVTESDQSINHPVHLSINEASITDPSAR